MAAIAGNRRVVVTISNHNDIRWNGLVTSKGGELANAVEITHHIRLVQQHRTEIVGNGEFGQRSRQARITIENQMAEGRQGRDTLRNSTRQGIVIQIQQEQIGKTGQIRNRARAIGILERNFAQLRGIGPIGNGTGRQIGVFRQENVKHLLQSEPRFWNGTVQIVIGEIDVLESAEVGDRFRDGAREFVFVDGQKEESILLGNGIREFSGQLILGNVQNMQIGQGQNFRGKGSIQREFVFREIQRSHVGQPRKCIGIDRPGEGVFFNKDQIQRGHGAHRVQRIAREFVAVEIDFRDRIRQAGQFRGDFALLA